MLQVGDVVRLKSGSPEMTIISIVKNEVECGWFNWEEMGFRTATFLNKEVLEKIESKDR